MAVLDEILEEAIATVRDTPTEELLALVSPEPVLEGDTSFGLNRDWITWYAKTHNVRMFKAINEGRWRLRQKRRNKQK